MEYIIEKSYVDITGSFEGSVILQLFEKITTEVKNKKQNFDGYIPLKLEEIKELTGLSIGISTISRYIKKLEKKGFVQSKKNKALNNISCYYYNFNEVEKQVEKSKKIQQIDINDFILNVVNNSEVIENKNEIKKIKENNKINVKRFNALRPNINVIKEKKVSLKSNDVNCKGMHQKVNRDLNNNLSVLNYEEVIKNIRNQINYSYLLSEHPFWQEKIDGIVDIISEVYINDYDIKISGQMKPIEAVKSVFRRLDVFKVEIVIEKFEEQVNKIHNIKGYLTTSLYNQVIENDFYWSNRVISDIYK